MTGVLQSMVEEGEWYSPGLNVRCILVQPFAFSDSTPMRRNILRNNSPERVAERSRSLGPYLPASHQYRISTLASCLPAVDKQRRLQGGPLHLQANRFPRARALITVATRTSCGIEKLDRLLNYSRPCGGSVREIAS
jgi:hypothetical protein